MSDERRWTMREIAIAYETAYAQRKERPFLFELRDALKMQPYPSDEAKPAFDEAAARAKAREYACDNFAHSIAERHTQEESFFDGARWQWCAVNAARAEKAEAALKGEGEGEK